MENSEILKHILNAPRNRVSVIDFVNNLKMNKVDDRLLILFCVVENELWNVMDILMTKYKKSTSKIRSDFRTATFRLKLISNNKKFIKTHFEMEKRYFFNYAKPLAVFSYSRDSYDVDYIFEYEMERLEWYLDEKSVGRINIAPGSREEYAIIDILLKIPCESEQFDRYLELVIKSIGGIQMLKMFEFNLEGELWENNSIEAEMLAALQLKIQSVRYANNIHSMEKIYKRLAEIPGVVAVAFRANLKDLLIHADVKKMIEDNPELFIGV